MPFVEQEEHYEDHIIDGKLVKVYKPRVEVTIKHLKTGREYLSDEEAKAEYDVRRKLEKISIKQYGSSLHDHLVEQGGISENTEKPDLRTMNEKIADFKGSLQ